MKSSLNSNINRGFVVNLIVVVLTGIIYLVRVNVPMSRNTSMILDSSIVMLFVISLVLLVVVFFLIQKQLRSRVEARNDLIDSERLLQSVIDSSSNLITIKKLNGQYILANERFAEMINESVNTVIGRTDRDLFNQQNAEVIREADMEVLKAKEAISKEEVLEFLDGRHTFIEVKFPIYDAENKIHAIGGIATEISERKILEKSLEESNEFFNMSFDAMFIADEEKFLKVNPALCNALGYTEEELLAKPWLDIVFQNDRNRAKETLNQLIDGRKLVDMETRALTKAGSVKWFTLSTSIEKVNGKNLFYVVGHDITASKDLLKELKVYERFFNMSFDLLAVADGKRYLKLNPAYHRLLGYKPEELESSKIGFIAHPNEKDEKLKEVQKLVESRGDKHMHLKARMKAKDNTYKWFEWNATKDVENNLFYGAARDITEQVELEKEQKEMLQRLQNSEQRLRLIIENISDGIIVVDGKGNIIMANDIANGLYQKHGDKMIKERLYELYDLYYPDEKTVFPTQNLPVERALKGEESQDVEFIIRDDKKHIKKTVLMSSRPIVNKDSKVIAAVATIKDISRYKLMESELNRTKSKYQRVIGFKSALN